MEGDVGEAGVGKDREGFPAEVFVDFDGSKAAGTEQAGRSAGDGPVEDQGVGVRDEKRKTGLEIEHVTIHILFLGLHYVWRIGYYDIERCRREG